MAVLGAEPGTLQHRPRGSHSFIVKSGVKVYAHSLVGVDLDGWLIPYNNIATTRFAGICQETVTGNGTTIEARVDDSGVVLKNQTLAASSQATVNSLVYCTTDNPADLSLTAATSRAVGFVVRFNGGTSNDIELFTQAEQQCLPA